VTVLFPLVCLGQAAEPASSSSQATQHSGCWDAVGVEISIRQVTYSGHSWDPGLRRTQLPDPKVILTPEGPGGNPCAKAPAMDPIVLPRPGIDRCTQEKHPWDAGWFCRDTRELRFEDVPLPRLPLHVFIVDVDFIFHDLVFEHKTNRHSRSFLMLDWDVHRADDEYCFYEGKETSCSLRVSGVEMAIIRLVPQRAIPDPGAPLAPAITSISPNLVKPNRRTTLSVIGANLESGLTAEVITPTGTIPIAAGDLSFIDRRKVQVQVAMPGPGPYTATLRITNPGGGDATETFIVTEGPPPAVLAPVEGPFRVTGPDNPLCLSVPNLWTFCQHQNPDHSNLGIHGARDTYAWDMNLLGDADEGRPVFAVAAGRVVRYAGVVEPGGRLGAVLVEHDSCDGHKWWSGYLHMANIRVREGQEVSPTTHLGDISNVSGPPVGSVHNHLHFVVYEGENKPHGLRSVNVQFLQRHAPGQEPQVSVSTDRTYWTQRLDRLARRLVEILPPPKSSWLELPSMNLTGQADDYFEVYLLAGERNWLAANAVAGARAFLKKGDYLSTAKYYDEALRFERDSWRLFAAAEAISQGSLERAVAVVEDVYRASKYSAKILAGLACHRPCRNVVDAIFQATDFAIRYSDVGPDEAFRHLVAEIIVRAFIMDRQAEKYLTKSIGQSGLYDWISQRAGDPDFRKALMRLVARSGVIVSREALENAVDRVLDTLGKVAAPHFQSLSPYPREGQH